MGIHIYYDPDEKKKKILSSLNVSHMSIAICHSDNIYLSSCSHVALVSFTVFCAFDSHISKDDA